MPDLQKTFIVSNRLPVKLQRGKEGFTFQNSEGGLATGLGSVFQTGKNLWIGWPGDKVLDEEKEEVTQGLLTRSLLPVFLTEQEIEDYYEGFSNETLWPLFHYFPSYSTFLPHQFEVYKNVNQKFADAIISVASPNDIIWIQDYQLMLVPQMVRQAMPEITIGFFLHIPFPSYEVFRLLPWRRELIEGLLGADVLGYHTYDDVRHFLSSVSRIVNLPIQANQLQMPDGRMVVADAFPISIDYQKYHEQADSRTTRRLERKIRSLMHTGKHLLSIDRLDYSKGIVHRLLAFQEFLRRHPEMTGKVSMIQLVVPSRDNVPKYKELKDEINQLVSDINSTYGKLGWQPIQYFYRSYPLPLLSALYRLADVAMVTPMRDGMNLVCKEYIASRTEKTGVLILSEMAGAARELTEALIVNPNDIWQVGAAIHQALTMSEQEQKRRMSALQATVSRFDIHNWVKNFMDKLSHTRNIQQDRAIKALTPAIRHKLAIGYHFAASRLLFLDYDGTLVPFYKNAQDAVPDAELLKILKNLTNDPANKVIIISGRDHLTLHQWLGHLPVYMVAEHGAWHKDFGGEWKTRADLTTDWKEEIRNIMKVYVSRTPGAVIEEKSYSLAWHYRGAEAGMGTLRAQELTQDVSHYVSDRNLQVLQGDKVLEVKNSTVNKGNAALRCLAKYDATWHLAIGDDTTDEDTFKAMPEDAVTIKVGLAASAAKYKVATQDEVRSFLQELCLTPAFTNPEVAFTAKV